MLGFVLLVLVNAILFLRPGDLLPSIAHWPIYFGSLLLACAVATPRLAQSESWHALAGHPVTWCVGGLLCAIVLSHLMYGRTWEARHSGIEFSKVLLFYLLLLLAIDTPERLRQFLLWLAIIIAILVFIAVLQFFGLIQLFPTSVLLEERDFDAATGQYVIIPRLRGMGLFHDPNDLCLILVLGIMLCVWQLDSPRGWPIKTAFLVLLLSFAYALVLSQSRGGLLAALAALGTWACFRWGWRKAALAGIVVLPVLLMGLGGRIARVSTGEDTAQGRIHLWSEALLFFRQAPLFGIGEGQFAEEVGLVTHNSFLHCFAELGFLGGALFLSAFLLSLLSLYRLAVAPPDSIPVESRRLSICLLSIVVGYAVGLLSLSRAYITPTYLVLGLAVVYSQLEVQAAGLPRPAMKPRLVAALGGLSILFIVATYVFVRFAITRV